MQKLSEIFEKLTTGELSQVSIGGANSGELLEKDYRAVGNHVMLGLTALYKRFDLKRSLLVVELVPDLTEYMLHSRYAVNGKQTNEPVRYIIDSMKRPFKDDILKILGVTNDEGCNLSLNDNNDRFSLRTPTIESLLVPLDVVNQVESKLPDEYKTDRLIVQYQANHANFIPRIGYFDPENTTIELPSSHTQALLYFVASRVHNPIGMGQEFNAGNNWNARYEQECQRLEADGNELEIDLGNHRARRNGWV